MLGIARAILHLSLAPGPPWFSLGYSTASIWDRVTPAAMLMSVVCAMAAAMPGSLRMVSIVSGGEARMTRCEFFATSRFFPCTTWSRMGPSVPEPVGKSCRSSWADLSDGTLAKNCTLAHPFPLRAIPSRMAMPSFPVAMERGLGELKYLL